MDKLLLLLGDEIDDADEEVFLVFSSPIPSSLQLGFISSSSSTLTVTVNGEDHEVHQSPGLLSSNAALGTTGAVLWKVTPLVAEWLSKADNVLFRTGVLGSSSHVLELGCGVSGLIPRTLRKRVDTFVASDLDYILRSMRKNLDDGDASHGGPAGRKDASSASRQSKQQQQHGSKGKLRARTRLGTLLAMELDWSTCSSQYLEANLPVPDAVDCVLACDCIYNEALVEPFVQTCAAACSLRPHPPVCIVAQQLRTDIVFEAWIKTFIRYFHVYRLPNDLLSSELREGGGYVVHLGVLRNKT